MKCSKVVVLSLMLACTIGASGFAFAKTTQKTNQKSSQNDSLDSIELDLDDAPPAKKTAPKKAQPRKPAAVAVDEIELDEAENLEADLKKGKFQNPAAPKKRAPAQAATPAAPVVEAPVAKETLDVISAAEALEKEKKFDAVIEKLVGTAESSPRRGLLVLARAYKAKGDNAHEAATLELCLAKNPNDYVVQTLLAEVYMRMKKTDLAVEAFTMAKSINPRYKPAYIGLWDEFEREQDRDSARQIVTDMVKIFGEEPALLTALCRLYALDGFLEKSVEVCRQAIDKDPTNAENHVHLGMSLRDQQKPTEAWKVFENASKRFPASESVQSTAGELKVSRKEYAVAYDLYKKAVIADEKSARAWLGLANSSFELQKNQEAMDAFVRACKIDRKNTREFRVAHMKLRARKDALWDAKFEEHLAECY